MYVIKHCGRDKHIRDGAPDEPGLKGYSHFVREVCIFAYLVTLPMRGSSGFVLWQISRGYVTAACEPMFCVWRKRRRLTYVPPMNAAVAPTIEDWANCEIYSRTRQRGNITKQIRTHSHHDSFFPSTHIR